MNKDIHIHWVVQGYEKLDKKNIMYGVVEITVLTAKDEKDAIKRAKELVKRPFYRLFKTWECSQCNKSDLQMEIQMTTLELMKKALLPT